MNETALDLLVEWNDTTAPFPQNVCVHQLFEAQAALTPEAPAVLARGELLSYGELDRLANRLAEDLRAGGVGPDVPVAIFMERSPEMVVAILAALKAGGAYLPIDPASPPERLAFMLQDAAVPVLLTRETPRQGLGKLAAWVVSVDLGELRPGSAKRPLAETRPENLAYVIYTSGSTGRPKGTELAHTGLLNLVAWHQRTYDVTAADRATQLAGPGFDAAVWELWPYLTAGAAIHIPPPEVVADPARLLPWLGEEGITLSFLPTPLAEAVLAEPLPPGLALRALLTGGDRLHRRPERPLPFALVNHYGPTECTVVTTWTPVEPAVGERAGDEAAPAIGRPLANTRVYLLAADLEPVPFGDEGELHVAGVGLARGYRNRPGLTAEKLVPDPFATEPGERLYKTGDLVRHLPGGDLEFLDRIDHQVKIRGFRIELGEVEVALSHHLAVREAAVVLAEAETGAEERRMVAYMVGKKGAGDLDAAALRDHLGRSLPDYMLPAVFIPLEALPLTPNGKVDRAALSRRPVTVPSTPAGEGPPCSPVEELLAGIWTQVLGVERVGPDDNFYELGGHSLLATRLVSRVRQALGVELALPTVLEKATFADLATALAELSGATPSAATPPEPVSRELPLPLSFAQQRLWFLDRFEPGSALYNIPITLRLTGRLECATLARALNEIASRHEVLRTCFAALDEMPVQVIRPGPDLPLPLSDLAGLPPSRRRTEARRLVLEEARRPFDLARGPVLRTRLLRQSTTRHLLLLTVHHIAFDGWSLGVFLRELAALYRAFSAGAAARGTASPLPELGVQYADFAVWQRRWLEGEVLERQLAYWRQQLAGLPVLELPTDRPRPAVQSFRGAAEHFRLPPELSRGLEELGRRHGSTLFMTLLAAFQTLAALYTGQRDVAVGSPIANRNRAEIEGLIGFFVNTLVLRGDLGGDPTFAELSARVRATAVAAYVHQDLPFERLVEELEPERNLSHNPLVQVVFLLQNVAMAPPELAPGLAASFEYVYNGTAKFDLTVGLEEAEGGLRGDVEYNTDLFDGVTLRRLAGHYRTLLEGLVAAPERRLSELSLLSAAERHQVLPEWNDTAVTYPAEAPIHELFEARVAASPEAVAVVCENPAERGDGLLQEQVSYRELNRRANRLAHYLRAQGVGPEVCVALCLERSVEMVVGILGILKAGGAYVPLDLSYPPERLASMLEDAGSSLLLTQERLSERFAKVPIRRVCLDSEWSTISRHSPENPRAGATAENLAYVMFTSGSTGRPKGVSIIHRGVVRLVRGAGYAELGEQETFLQLAPISFDASTLEIWAAFLGGGRLVVFPPYTPSLQELGAVLERQEVTILWLTAGLFHQMVDENLEGLRGVRQLLAGGDVISARHVKRVLEELPGRTVINGYGPTENTTFTCCHPMGEPGAVEDPVSIGRPISSTRVSVLDRHLRQQGVGIPGELCIGGDGLARGYLKRPGLTAESFIPDPRGAGPGARLYRTGDVVRTLADGRIDFQGRRDHQVKVRGFRIELGEVEAVLGEHPAVRKVAVVVHQEVSGDQRLVAYVVAEGVGAAETELRDFLRPKLPGYMVPSAFVFLETLPLNPNGKVDRVALSRRPLPAAAPATAHGQAPGDPLEELLASIWARVLGVERVGVHDDFFELGGHSLLATQVVSRIHRELGVEAPLRIFFERSTVAALAEYVAAALRRVGPLETSPVRPAARRGRLPLSFAQQRLWFLDRFEPDSVLYNIPTALRLEGPLEAAALARALGEIVRRHEVLRTAYETVDGEAFQAISSALVLLLPVFDLQALPAAPRRAAAQRLAWAEAHQPFDLARGPVLRVRLLRLGVEEHVLLLTVHHIAFDGWSLGVFLRELAALYRAFSTGTAAPGTAPPLPELPVQYADFAVWQRQWLAGEVLESQLPYWREQLAGLPVLELPTDRPRPAVQSFRGATEHFRLPAELFLKLQELSRRHGSTLFMTLLAAFQTLAGRYTGQDDVAVGSPIANRNRAEIEGLVGFFVNTQVLRGDLRGDPTFGELSARVRDVALAAYAHQDLPFEKLVEELEPERNLSQNPLVQVLFLLQNVAMAPPELAPGLAASFEFVYTGTAKFDLTVGLEEAQGGLRVDVEYNTDLFDGVTLRRLAGHFRTLLEGVVADPGRRLSELPLLLVAERHQVVLEWNDTGSRPGRGRQADALLHELFEAQVAQTPDAVAVVFEGRCLSYRELNGRANQLARRLRALDAGRKTGPSDTLVGICAERSPELVVGLLGILKSGGAYVPMDPSYPGERLAFMMEDSDVPVLLTQEHLEETLPAHSAAVIRLDADWLSIAGESREDLTWHGAPESLAYTIFTSGSTGRPKGAMVSHRAIVNRLLWMQQTYGLGTSDRVLQKTPFSFDVSVWEFFWPLMTGACLVVARPGGHQESGYLVRRIVEEGVTTLHFVPSMLQAFLEHPEAGRCRSIRRVVASGETLPYELEQRFFELLDTELHNLYGPTEAAVDVTYEPCGRSASVRPVAIGRPVANTRIHVLDRRLSPVPAGVPGELHIGGVQLARGYVSRPVLTAEAFIPDPLGAEPGGRLYKSGDLVRHLPGGAVDYLGRLDHQIKIRGQRIELGEIESVLVRHPAVRQAVVVVREDPARLVAYLLTEGGSPQAGELRSFLAHSLPDYMVPAAFVVLDALPLTPSGKVDRRALPAPKPDDGLPAGAWAPPRSPLEEVLAGIFSQVLGRDRVGIHDNFFELGGHSLLATQVVSRVRRDFGVEPPLRTLFERPTVAGLAEWVTAALRRDEGLEAPPMRPVARHAHLPLSFAQQRLWFLDRLAPGSPLYNIPMTLRLTGRLDLRSLEHALIEIVRRHEVLRTCFETEDEKPVQVIRPIPDLSLPTLELAGLPAARRQAEARRLEVEEAHRPFDLARGPVLRARLLRMDAVEHVLLVTVHHIAFDGWSQGVFLRELAALYQAFSAGTAAPGTAPLLAELPVQYVDFAVWQRQWLAGEVLESQLSYWRKELAGLPVLELPTDWPRPAVQSFRGVTERFPLPAELFLKLQELSQRHGSTLFMTLLAAFQTLAGRYTGQDDFAVGSPTANRNRAEIEGLIGFFVNTLVLRGDLRGDPSFGELLARVRDVALGAYAHQDVSFEKLVEELEPERNLSQNPLVQVLFLVQNAALAPELAPGLVTSFEYVDTDTAKFDLTVGLEEAQGGLWLDVEYNTDLFDGVTLRRLAGHFRTLLEGVVADPGRRLSELPLLPAAERHQVVLEWNDTGRGRPADALLHELFEAQVARTPDAVAVVFEGRCLSYRELNGRANQLARRLRTLAAGWKSGPFDTLVGICAERSPELVVGLLGILKSGGAYVPMDPSYPGERLAFMMEDSDVPVLLTQEHLAETLPAHSAAVIRLDADWPSIADESRDNLPWHGAPESLAYTIFTSGSTGRPKGAMVSHRAIVNRLLWMQQTYGLGPSDRVLQKTPFSFDVSVWEFFWPLMTGSCLVVARPGGHQDPGYLVRRIVEEGVTTLHFVPSMLQAFLEHPEAGSCRSIRRVVASGEALPYDLEQRFFELLDTELHNLYGPTEAAVDVTYEPCGRSVSPRPVAIGRPVANTRIHVLDRCLSPVPAGVPGELHIGGVQLARGYVSRPVLTAKAFIPDPMGAEPGGRLYKTGDLVRHLPGGAVDYLGRLDHQVKIRGLRIELGEIESVLARHPAVRQAVVVVREDPAARLVAYLLVQGGSPPAGELRSFLAQSLPEYMVPAALVVLDALPLTPSGKVDRRALPAPRPDDGLPAGAWSPPRSPLEEALAGIFSQVLGRDRVGIHDNFFELGGHSLLATQVVSWVRRDLGVEPPLRTLFERPTVAGLAEWVTAALRQEEGLEAPPMRPVARDAHLPLSFAQQRLWFLDRLAPGSPLYNISMVLRLTGRLDLRSLEHALQEIVRRHEVLRTCFTTEGEKPVQVIRPIPDLSLPTLELAGLPAARRQAEARRLEVEDAHRSFDLARGPVLRTQLLRMDAAEHVLLFTVHHIAFDGWSQGVFLRELAALYQAFSAGTAVTGTSSPLAELPVQYADFAVWQRQWLAGEVLESQLSYWREKLAGLPVLELPTDRPRPAVQTSWGVVERFRLPAELFLNLQELSQRHGSTLFMTLLAAFQTLAGRYTGQDDFAVGSPIANRNRAEIEGLVGFFVNTLVLRGDLRGDPTFGELLARVRDVALGAYAHQDVSFEKLVEELDPERNLSQNPLVQVLFLVQNAAMPSPELAPGLAASFEPVYTDTAKFDLTVGLEEAQGGLRLDVEYNTDLFDSVTLRRLVVHFRTLLEGVVADPGRRLSDLPLLPAAQRHQLLEWNDTRAAGAAETSFHQLFRAQVERRPEAVVAVCEDRSLTYRELEARANAVAHLLKQQGVGPEDVVALLAERDLSFLVAMLGIFKSGGVYLPLDPLHPPRRLARVLEQAGARLILAADELAGEVDEALELVSETRRAPRRSLEELLSRQAPATPPPWLGSPGQLAYVIFTSGSTGLPKGAMLEYRGMLNHLHAKVRDLALGPSDVVAQTASQCFDISVWQFLAALLVGGQVQIFPPRVSQDPKLLLDAAEAAGVAVLETVPSMMRFLLQEAGGRSLAALRWLLPTGEALPVELARQWLTEFPGVPLVNAYGPTECSDDVTHGFITEPPAPNATSVPIGRPLVNLRLFVLDDSFQPVPVGVAGELCVTGVGVGRGYLHDPRRTAEVFVPHPSSPEPGARMYRTGDLARYRPQSNLEFVGRIDHQVKLRGFRIELGEVEAVLAAHPEVRETVVLVHEDGAHNQRLIGWVVAAPGSEVTSGDLRRYLKERLAEYMVPAAMVFLDAMPLTPNGKVDRAELGRRAPDTSGLALEEDYVAPETEIEEILVEIWQLLLGVDRVGIYDNFFDLGGHSLLVPQLFARIYETFQLELPLQVLFEAPTVAELAMVIEERLLDQIEAFEKAAELGR